VHLPAAYLPAQGVVLMQVAVETKGNELVAAPRLLSSLDLRGRVVSGDALFTPRDLSVAILAQGGDYIWYAQDNQRRLREDIALFFVPSRQVGGWHRPPMPQTQARSTTRAHGRLKQRGGAGDFRQVIKRFLYVMVRLPVTCCGYPTVATLHNTCPP
jgi:predicted transposase YbfD/YdcC